VKHEPFDAKLERYTKLLAERAVPAEIVAASDSPRLRERHVDDSLRALPCLAAAARVADVGSGGGLPGIPVAVARPDLEVVLIEPRRARVAFLELCVEALELSNVRVIHGRAETSGVIVDTCMARAVGDAATTWRLTRPLLRIGGWTVYFAGASWSEREEVALAALGIHCTRCAPASFPWQGPVVRMAEEEHRSSVERRS
jgi:16S rRNA (guanine527-N7)-methyltransferase